MHCGRLWTGMYPAVTTQFTETLEVDVTAARKGLKSLIKDGADGLIVLGSCSEGQSLDPREKRAVLDVATEASDGRLPVVAGVSEPTAAGAMDFARDAQALGVDALMLLPTWEDVRSDVELFEHVCRVAAATTLPIMLNGDSPCSAEISMYLLDRLADIANIAAIKEPDSRRLPKLFSAFGERYALMADLGHAVPEGPGVKGWVSGIAAAFPKEAAALVREYAAGRHERARRLHRWFLPLLHFDVEPDFVQAIKLAEQMVGRGSERVRLPRLPLSGGRRSEVIAIVEYAIATRPGSALSDQEGASTAVA